MRTQKYRQAWINLTVPLCNILPHALESERTHHIFGMCPFLQSCFTSHRPARCKLRLAIDAQYEMGLILFIPHLIAFSIIADISKPQARICTCQCMLHAKAQGITSLGQIPLEFYAKAQCKISIRRTSHPLAINTSATLTIAILPEP